MVDENKGMLADLKGLGLESSPPTSPSIWTRCRSTSPTSVTNCLLAMEHGDSTSNKEDANAAAVAKAKLECDTTAKDLEEDTCNGSHGL